MNSKRIMHITTVHPSLGFIAGQPRFLTDSGYYVVVVCSPDRGLEVFAESEGVKGIGVPMERKISPLADGRSIARLARIMRKEKITIVHAHTPKGGLLGMISATLARVPVRIYQIHGFPYMGLNGWKKKLLMTTERVSSLLASQVLCVSRSVANVAIDDNILSPAKIRVLGSGSANGVDALGRFDPGRYSDQEVRVTRSSLGIDEQALVVAFIGRLARDKGIQELVVAWELVRQVQPKAVLLLLGSDDERDPIPDHLRAKMLNDESIILAGHQSDIPLFLACSDILALPTYREGYPTVLLEAAAMEVPVVASRVPGCTDAVIDGVTGILVPARAPQELANAVVRLLDDEHARRSLGRAGRQRVLEEYAPETLWKAYMAEYERLTNENMHRRHR